MKTMMVTRAVAAASLAAALAAAATAPVLAQSREAETRTVLERAARDYPALKFDIDRSTGLPSRMTGLAAGGTVGGSLGASRAPTPDEARAAAEAFFSTGALSAAFETKGVRSEYKSTRARRDPDIPGQTVVQIEQRVGGVPVFGSTARVVVSPTLAVTQLNANLSAVEIASTTPKIDAGRAIASARERLKKELSDPARSADPASRRLLDRADSIVGRADLVVFDPALLRRRGVAVSPARLSYLVALDTFRVFVDAETGEALYLYRDQPSTMQRRIFDLGRGRVFPGKKAVDEATGERVDPLSEDARLAFDNSGRVHAYFAQMFSRRGIKDVDGPALMEAYVQFGDLAGAYWCKSRSFDCPAPGVMVYGPQFARAIDVIGHEVTHGVITEEADLVYADEPGAVNEALADIFGVLIEFHARGGEGAANWVLGEDLPGFSVTSPLRNLADPPMTDPNGGSLFNRDKGYSFETNRGQPDHYDQYVDREHEICRVTSDYYVGCVHINSGIFNKFAFLVAEGGRHRGTVVKGIGREKMGRIAYRALTTQITASSGLAQSAEGFVSACVEYVASGVPGFAEADCDQVRLAQKATGLVIPTG